MANLKDIRKRIGSVKSTQKITRAMKMVSAAKLNRAQQAILALRPYAVEAAYILSEIAAPAGDAPAVALDDDQPLLVRREEKRTLALVLTGDRGLCGGFNANVAKLAEREWRAAVADGREYRLALIGRKGRDYFRRRGAPIAQVFDGVWDALNLDTTRDVARALLRPLLAGEVDAIHLVYNEFKSAMTQRVVVEPLLPITRDAVERAGGDRAEVAAKLANREFMFEPSRSEVLARLVPMYVEVSILRALYESMASELGARMTAMDAATKNASEMIAKLTLQYNRARQAAITTELMEIISGSEALKG